MKQQMAMPSRNNNNYDQEMNQLKNHGEKRYSRNRNAQTVDENDLHHLMSVMKTKVKRNVSTTKKTRNQRIREALDGKTNPSGSSGGNDFINTSIENNGKLSSIEEYNDDNGITTDNNDRFPVFPGFTKKGKLRQPASGNSGYNNPVGANMPSGNGNGSGPGWGGDDC